MRQFLVSESNISKILWARNLIDHFYFSTIWNVIEYFCFYRSQTLLFYNREKLLELHYDIEPNANGVDIVKVSEDYESSQSDVSENDSTNDDCDLTSNVSTIADVEEIWDWIFNAEPSSNLLFWRMFLFNKDHVFLIFIFLYFWL